MICIPCRVIAVHLRWNGAYCRLVCLPNLILQDSTLQFKRINKQPKPYLCPSASTNISFETRQSIVNWVYLQYWTAFPYSTESLKRAQNTKSNMAEVLKIFFVSLWKIRVVVCLLNGGLLNNASQFNKVKHKRKNLPTSFWFSYKKSSLIQCDIPKHLCQISWHKSRGDGVLSIIKAWNFVAITAPNFPILTVEILPGKTFLYHNAEHAHYLILVHKCYCVLTAAWQKSSTTVASCWPSC